MCKRAMILFLACILLVIPAPGTSLSAQEETVPVQAQAVEDTYSNLIMTGWRGNESYYRTTDISGNSSTSVRSAWRGSYLVGDFPGSGNILTISYLRGPSTVYQSIWRAGNGVQGYFRQIPIASGGLNWNGATQWEGPLPLSSFPGFGAIQAHGDVLVGNTVYQTLWRGNQGWFREVPVVNGVIQWPSSGAGWQGPIPLGSMPGSGDMQAQDNYVIGSLVWQHMWRSNTRWTRSVPIINGIAQWNQASTWSNTTSDFSLPDPGINISAAGSLVVYNYSATTQTPEPWISPSSTWSPAEERKSHSINNTNFYLAFSDTTSQDMRNAAAEAASYYDVISVLQSGGGFRIEIDEKPRGGLYAGWARPKRGNDYCYIEFFHTPTGNCNQTDRKADNAVIYLDSTQYNTLQTRIYVALHEMGHVFGLYHVPCTVNSVMRTGCPSPPTWLQTLEIVWINHNYVD